MRSTQHYWTLDPCHFDIHIMNTVCVADKRRSSVHKRHAQVPAWAVRCLCPVHCGLCTHPVSGPLPSSGQSWTQSFCAKLKTIPQFYSVLGAFFFLNISNFSVHMQKTTHTKTPQRCCFTLHIYVKKKTNEKYHNENNGGGGGILPSTSLQGIYSNSMYLPIFAQLLYFTSVCWTLKFSEPNVMVHVEQENGYLALPFG